MISTVKSLLLSGSVSSVEALRAHVVSAIFPAISQHVVISLCSWTKSRWGRWSRGRAFCAAFSL